MSVAETRGPSPPIVVVGGGAAGLVAAAFASAHKRPVVLLEKTSDGGRKILISGGGRCNVLPAALAPERFVTDSSTALLRRFLRSWPLEEQRAFIERDLGVPLAFEEKTQKWFPTSNRARDVRDGLVTFARRAGVEFRFNTTVIDARPEAGRWRVSTSDGEIEAGAVVLATGGLSVPATGSDGAGLSIASRLSHVVHDTYPALTPLTGTTTGHAALSGISLPVRLRAAWSDRVTESRGGFLFTHRGYSGPVVLDVSHVAVRSQADGRARATVRVQWSDLDADGWRRALAPSADLASTVVGRQLPQRLADQLIAEAGVPRDRRTADLPRAEREALVQQLTTGILPWTGDEGYRKAEVTGGGVALSEVDARTLESRRHRGLFLCGELLDAFGPIGGHNFAWAWATGRLAGQGAAAMGADRPS